MNQIDGKLRMRLIGEAVIGCHDADQGAEGMEGELVRESGLLLPVQALRL